MGNSAYSSGSPCKVVFAGEHFPSGFEYTVEAIKKIDKHNQVVVKRCAQNDLLNEVSDTTVLVPLMSKVTKNIIEHAPNLKLIMQFGVGLEGNFYI